jgi:hypothetical protein
MFKYLFIFFLPMIIPKCVGTTNTLNTIKEEGVISKMTLKISSSAGLKYILITNAKKLDTINTVLKETKEIYVQQGGSFEISSDISVFKNGKQANFFVEFSKYNGWMIVIENRTFSSDYIFNLIKQYSGFQ